MMAIASVYSPRSPETSVAASNTSTMKSLNWFNSRASGDNLCPSASWLGPTFSSRFSASECSSPSAGSTSKWVVNFSMSQSR